MRIDESIDYIKKRYRFIIDETSLTILNEDTCWWVANATTPYLEARGEKLILVVREEGCNIIKSEVAPALAQWFSQHWLKD